jgi:cytochrome c peroxidase
MAAGETRRCPLPSCALLAAIVLAGACGSEAPAPARLDPPDVALGKRLFRETRFAQHFAARAGGDMNRLLADGDATVASVDTPEGPVAGPYRGLSVNCASCHLSDELLSRGKAGARAFVDFAPRSPIPPRDDGLSSTTRNTTTLVDVQVAGSPVLLHADGEFGSTADLVAASFVGRNFGWLPEERAEAVVHLARVIREDDGTGPLAREFEGLSYRVVLAGADAAVPSERRLPEALRLDVEAASDDQILRAVARVVGSYLESLVLARDGQQIYRGSPYDHFLRKNGLPARPDPGEAASAYGERLYTLLAKLASPAFVDGSDGHFTRHDQRFAFGPLELRGLQTFLGQPGESAGGPPGVWACSSCHPPPHFTDFGFHNTGVSQLEYDTIHGPGAFAALEVPGLQERGQDDLGGRGRFRDAPAKDRPGHVDLGVWNVVGNPAAPSVQPALQQTLCPMIVDGPGPCALEDLLPFTIGAFKTRGLRNLGLSGPYFHNGRAAELEDAITHYMVATLLLAKGELRSGDLALEWLRTKSADVTPLAAFLRSLNED